MKFTFFTFAIGLTLLLTGCGGGGEDWASKDPSAKAVSANSFDIQMAWTQLNMAPNTSPTLTVTGSCEGNYVLSNAAIQNSEESGVTYHYNRSNVNRSYFNCAAPFQGGANYYTSLNYFVLEQGQYKNYYAFDDAYVYVWRATATFPTAAKVGDAGVIGIIDSYQNNALAGVDKWSYVIEEDTASSVVFNLVVKAYDASQAASVTHDQDGTPYKTEQFRYVVGPSGSTIKLRTYDRKDASGFTIHAQ